jgi:hypothetical protein
MFVIETVYNLGNGANGRLEEKKKLSSLVTGMFLSRRKIFIKMKCQQH